MNKELVCYCGLYCGNCAVKVRIDPAAKVLHREMKNAGFESFIHFMPDGKPFWDFLTGMSETGTCSSCLTGGGNPDCPIRICAKKKNVEACAFCGSFPCSYFDPMLAAYPGLLERLGGMEQAPGGAAGFRIYLSVRRNFLGNARRQRGKSEQYHYAPGSATASQEHPCLSLTSGHPRNRLRPAARCQRVSKQRAAWISRLLMFWKRVFFDADTICLSRRRPWLSGC